MRLPRSFLFRTIFILLGCSALHCTTQAHVTAALVARETSIQPGRSFTVALHLTHDPHWHTYWVNAGTGYPTKLAWDLPPGWSVGEIQWPTPKVIKDHAGNVTGNGYEGDLLLPVTLIPPATLKPGDQITLKAKAEWLMCNETCMPGEATVTLALPVSAETPTTDNRWGPAFAKIPLPTTPDGWGITAARSGKTIELTLSGSLAQPANAHFFSRDGLVQYDEPQAISNLHHGLRLGLPVSPSFTGNPTRLIGVLAYGDPDHPGGLGIDVELTTPAPASVPVPHRGLLPTLLLAFIGGLILNLMPCVFPVLGLKILGFVKQAGADKRKVTIHGIFFAIGVLLSFWALAGLLSILRAGGEELGWGYQLQSPAFVFVLTSVMLVFGLNLSGLFEFGLSATSVGSGLQSRSGYTGSFFTGILATVVATPCSAPFLAPALGVALAVPLTARLAIFSMIAIGLSAPYLLLSIFPSAVKMLPRPGAWMETFKQFMAFPLYGTAGYLIWVLAGQSEKDGMENLLRNALFGLTLIAMAVWIYGRYTAPESKPARVRFGLIASAAVFVAGAFLGWPRQPKPTDIVWEKWSPAAVAAAQSQGKTVYVDFTARWCATCQTNKLLVFGSDEVKRVFVERGIIALKGDWTNHDSAITEELAKFGRSAVPFNLIYKPGTTEPILLPEFLTPAKVLEVLR